jgi:hypothetical protein
MNGRVSFVAPLSEAMWPSFGVSMLIWIPQMVTLLAVKLRCQGYHFLRPFSFVFRHFPFQQLSRLLWV